MDNSFDCMYYGKGRYIGGLDEVGVVDIAGPLVAACVVLPKFELQRPDVKLFEVDDSKKVPENFRKQLAEIIWQNALAIGIGEVQPAELDAIGKASAIRLAMARAVVACRTTIKNRPLRPDFLMVDAGKGVIAPLAIPQKGIAEGGTKSLCIAAAGIIAKVYRDDIMIKLHQSYPYYKWNSNKGYPCEDHFLGLDKRGVIPGLHRLKDWPFKKSSRGSEAIEWQIRRRKWRAVTERELSMEIAGGAWTLNPQSLEDSMPSNDSTLKTHLIGSASMP
jgi:ribonuclease HII